MLPKIISLTQRSKQLLQLTEATEK